MRGSLGKKTAVLLLAASMAAGLTACGDETSVSTGKQRYFKADYLSDLPETFNETVNSVIFHGDTMYYGASNSDYTQYGIYSYNLVSGESAELYVQEQPETGNYSNITNYAVADNGDVYLMVYTSEIDTSSVTEDYTNATLDDVLAYFEDEWGYSAEEAEKDWNEYYVSEYTAEDGTVDYGKFLITQKAGRINKSGIIKADASGTVVFEKDITPGDATDSSCNGMAVDKDGNLYIAMNTWSNTGDVAMSDEYYTLVLDKDGNEKGKIQSEGYTSRLVTLADGTVASAGWADSGNCELVPLDAASMKEQPEKAIEVPSDAISVVDDKNMLITEGASVYKYNIDTKEKEMYFNWIDCNISSSSVNSYGVLSDGTVAAYIQNWNSSGSQTEVAVVKEVDASEITDIKNLTLAMLWMNPDVEEKIIAFNKSQDSYHITIKTYGDGNMEYEDALNNYMTAITSDPDIDIVLFNGYADALNFTAKGLNADLYALMEKDEELSREDFLPNILTACEYDGKLAFLPTAFSLQTVVGKAEDVGTEPGWTVQEMKELLASKPEGTQLFYGMDRGTALMMSMSLGYNDFINWEDSSCNFDSREFIEVLEFAALFPEQFEYTADSEDSNVLLNEGKVLLDQYYLGDFEQIQMYRAIFGGDTTFIGFPTSEGNGAMLNLINLFGISNNCEDLDGAWQFLRTFYMPKETSEEEVYYNSYGFSTRKDEFEKFCENAMKEKEGTSTWSWGDFTVEIQPATQEEVDEVKDLVYHTTAVSGAVSEDISNIIMEEAAAFFSGQKTAEDVAGIIQSRMQVYLSETK